MTRDKQIEEMAKVVNRLTFDLRQNMTSVTRYVRHERAKHPNLTEGQFIDRHLEYRELALVAVDNILKCLNENDKLREIEKMSVEDNGYRKSTDVAEEIFAEIEKTLKRNIARSKPRFEKLKNRDEDFLSKWGYEDMGYFKGVISTCEDFQDIIAELKKKYIESENNNEN